MLAALFLVALARFRSCPLGPVGFFAGMANASFFFRDLSLFRLAQASVGERMSAGAAFFVGECAKHHTGRLRNRRARRWRRCHGRRSRSQNFGGRDTLWRRNAVGCRRSGFLFNLARTGDAALYFLDDNRLAAAVAETLAHHALLNAAAL